MHMADALISPAVGVSFRAASGAMLAYCAGRITAMLDDHMVPLTGVLGALGVVVETLLSGRNELTAGPFAALLTLVLAGVLGLAFAGKGRRHRPG